MSEKEIQALLERAKAGDEAAAEKLIEMSAEVLAEFAYGGE